MLLVIVKDRRFLEKLKQHLKLDEMRIFFVESCEDAVFVLDSMKTALILVDLAVVTQREDWELLQQLPKTHRAPMLFIHGNKTQALADRLKAKGFEHFAKLPFQVSELTQKVRGLLQDVDPWVGLNIGPVGQEVTLRRKLGSGAMGMVYEALQPSLDRRVAVKFLSQSLQESDPEAAVRFQREARAVAQLRNPHIIQVFFIGVHDGRAYSVMEYVDGPTLDRLLKANGSLKPIKALRLCKDIFTGLVHAHAAGMVHRDMKPANVMLDSQGHAVILDFGLVREITGEVMTQAGTVLGTPRYIAPEQVRGGPVDHRADLYAVGIMLFEMLVGVPPFEGRDFVDILLKHVQEPLPRPEKFNRQVDPELYAIIQRLTAKMPDDRYQTASEVIADIDRFQNRLAAEDGETHEIRGPSQLARQLDPVSGVVIDEMGHAVRRLGEVGEDRIHSLYLVDNIVSQLQSLDDLGSFRRGLLNLKHSKLMIFPHGEGLAALESSASDASSKFHHASLSDLRLILEMEAGS